MHSAYVCLNWFCELLHLFLYAVIDATLHAKWLDEVIDCTSLSLVVLFRAFAGLSGAVSFHPVARRSVLLRWHLWPGGRRGRFVAFDMWLPAFSGRGGGCRGQPCRLAQTDSGPGGLCAARRPLSEHPSQTLRPLSGPPDPARPPDPCQTSSRLPQPTLHRETTSDQTCAWIRQNGSEI